MTGLADIGPAGRPRLAAVGVPGQHATKIERSVYSGRVAMLLREAIVDGRLAAGTALVESRVAEELQVSRGPVRSALHVLEGEGLVRTRRNGRSEVVGFGEQDLGDLLAARFELERTAIEWGCRRSGDVAPVRAAFAAIEAEGAPTDHLVDLDVAFHRAIVELSGSRFLLQAWLAIAPVIHTVITIGNRRLVVRDPGSNFERIVAAHRPLADSVEAHDAERAVAVLAEQFGVTHSMFEHRGDLEGAQT